VERAPAPALAPRAGGPGAPWAGGPAAPWSGAFTLGRIPTIEFGRGRVARLPAIVTGHGRRALLVTGARSFRATAAWAALVDGLSAAGVETREMTVSGEPSPDLVDDAVARFAPDGIDVVVGIGGGSVLDAAKAVAGMLRAGRSVMDHLEIVGRGLPFAGPAVPFVAVPTTAGTGSEATKNAVLSERGPAGFKRSFRDDRLVAAVAVVDPDLLDSCDRALIAADGMDAVTQLLEAYVSTGAGPVTDALALAGLAAARDALPTWHAAGPGRGDATATLRERMAFAALASGICLAHAGLGSVHGLAAPLGAALPVPHGVACGALLAPATTVNIAALTSRDPDGPGLRRYAEAGRVLVADPGLADAAARNALVDLLSSWTERLGIDGLGTRGLTAEAIPAIVAESRGGSMKTNPVLLTDDEVAAVLTAAM
jgi:alcohol dehydrogenase class IV